MITFIGLNVKPLLVITCSRDEDRLLEDLFKSYNPAARPVLEDSKSVEVKFGLTLRQIIDVVRSIYI